MLTDAQKQHHELSRAFPSLADLVLSSHGRSCQGRHRQLQIFFIGGWRYIRMRLLGGRPSETERRICAIHVVGWKYSCMTTSNIAITGEAEAKAVLGLAMFDLQCACG